MNKLPPIGYEILDHCNLNCRNCDHFSNIKEEYERPLERIEKEVRLIAENVPLSEFKISGGEPTIHSKIREVIILIREIIGNDVKLSLLTNGIKMQTMPESFFKLLNFSKTNVGMARYPINVDYDKIESKLTEHGIPFFSQIITEFGNVYKRIDPQGQQDVMAASRMCHKSGGCPYYDGEVIHGCRASFVAPFLNERFGYKIAYKGVSPKEPFDKIMKHLISPCPTCRFCKPGFIGEKWEVTKYE